MFLCDFTSVVLLQNVNKKNQLKIQTREFEPERMIPSKAAEKG